MDPSQQPARSPEVGLKILELMQQHEDVFAACGEICGACSAFDSQPLELGQQVRVAAVGRDVRRCRQCAQQPLQDRLGQESVPKHPNW